MRYLNFKETIVGKCNIGTIYGKTKAKDQDILSDENFVYV